MELRPVDQFFLKHAEPAKSCLQALREVLCGYNEHITEEWKYALPFYYYKGKMFCYLWIDKKTRQPYIGIMEGRNIDHPLLVQGDRKRAKLFYVDPEDDIPVTEIQIVLDMARALYK